jgi:3-oxoacyl-[acyl-carrier protein] reductase
MKIEGSVCVVTGAGRGLGYQIAVDLARAGARVFGCDISDQKLSDFEDLAEKEKLDIRLSICDVTEEDSVVRFFESIESTAGKLDVLVNNAGITRDGRLLRYRKDRVDKLSLQDFQAVLEVNLVGVFLCAREAAAIMAEQSRGVIINISSVSRAGNFGQTNYSASKAGVDAMTVTWSKELSRYQIRVAGVAPGYLNTEMVAAVNPEVLEKIVDQVPVKRLGEPAEIASTVRFIIENDFVNGRILEIDGGLRI